jgi:hypothetical protein
LEDKDRDERIMLYRIFKNIGSGVLDWIDVAQDREIDERL